MYKIAIYENAGSAAAAETVQIPHIGNGSTVCLLHVLLNIYNSHVESIDPQSFEKRCLQGSNYTEQHWFSKKITIKTKKLLHLMRKYYIILYNTYQMNDTVSKKGFIQ